MKSHDAVPQARDADPMKVLLIFPPPSDKYSRDYKNAIGSGVPLGVAHLGSSLERGGFKVEAFDFQIPGNNNTRLREVLRGGFGMIGLSVFTLSAHSAYDIIGKAREASPGSTFVVGGPHPTALGPAVLDECGADVAAFGEGEITIVELARAVAARESFDAVKGIAFRRGYLPSEIVTTAPQPPVEDLDTLPPPALHLFDIKKYAQPGAASLYFPSINMITSRGCPYDCSFCFKKLWGPRCRFMSVGRVMSDIAELRAKHGAGEVAFFDDTFTLDRDRALSLCEKMLEEKKPLPWRCNSRVDRVDAELLALMRRAGCYSIGFGIESGNAEVLKKCGKGITLEQVRNAVELARRAGIESRGYFIFNLHGDTRETMEETTRFALSLPLTVANFTMALPYIGTRLREIVENDPGCRVDSARWNDWSAYCDKEPLFTQGDVRADELKKIISRAYSRFYLRPSYILRALKRVNSFEQVKSYIFAAGWILSATLSSFFVKKNR
ncbi:MAG: coproporphyrinogen III oxidase [bacterium ADurb.Bin236]|nr:MAG: coproporphyrinogen III oxidase [bacterium ADurb.Bin236]